MIGRFFRRLFGTSSPQILCQCGHHACYHKEGQGGCCHPLVREFNGLDHWMTCACMHYIEAASPSVPSDELAQLRKMAGIQ